MAAARRRSVRISAGDIFEIPVPDGRSGYGQVIISGAPFYVVIFRELYAASPDLNDLLTGEILLVGWTLDSLIYHGKWKIVGNQSPISARVPFPSYKVRIAGLPHVHDFSGEKSRLATDQDWELFDYKTTVAPIRYQNALLAANGLGEWRNDYDELTVEHARDRALAAGL